MIDSRHKEKYVRCMQALLYACRHCYMHADISTYMQTLVNTCRNWYMHADIATCMQTSLHACRYAGKIYTNSHEWIYSAQTCTYAQAQNFKYVERDALCVRTKM